jgi:type IV secretion system protein VirB5
VKLNFKKFSQQTAKPAGAARGGDGIAHPLGNADRYMEKSAEPKRRAEIWRVAFYGMGAIAALLAVAVVYLQSQPRLVPYVVEVDKLGQVVPLERAAKYAASNEVLLIAQIASLVRDMRSVSSDADYESAVVIPRIYDFVTGPAREFSNDYFRANSPIVLGKNETVRVTINTVVRESPSSFRVEWTEAKRSPTGQQTGVDHWTGIFSYVLRDDQSNDQPGEDQLIANPLGLYITDISWSRLQ